MLLSPSALSEFKDSLLKKVFFGNQPTPELIAILMVYFVQGILGLARLAISFFLKDELALGPAEVAVLTSIAALPWVIKPVFGFISDGLPIFGYRRRPYLILSGLLGMLPLLALATVVDSAWEAVTAMAVASLSVVISDVIVDSIVVERTRGESISQAGSLQSLCWSASAFGGLVTAYFSGSLLEEYGTRTVFAITASFPLIVSVAAWVISESRVSFAQDTAGVRNQIRQLRQAITQKSIWMPTAFLLLLQITPSGGSAFFYFTTNELGFGPEFLGRVQLVTSIASLVGVWFFQRFLKTVPFRIIFGWTTVLATVLGMTTLLLVTHTNRALGIDDHWFSLGDSLILAVMGRIAFMPVLVLAARLCPPGIEATLFALLMSVENLGGILSRQLGALLTYWMGITATNFDNLWLLLLITNLSNLLPLPLLRWLPASDPQLDAQAEQTAH